MLIAFIPAHNEQDCIGSAIQGLKAQTVPPDRIVVVADNCTDDTIIVSKSLGCQVFETKGNTDKKAGALNQAFDNIYFDRNIDHVLVTDADCVLDPQFIETALETLEDERYGGVGGTFRGQDGGGFVGHLQRNEYARYARDVRRLKGRCLVLTGTATVFPVHVLREVRDGRLSGALPPGDGQGGIYDTSVLTEDNELSFALMHLGYKIISPAGCTLTTEVMPTWRTLWNQRLRWKRGAIENCFQYGLTRVTARYWGRQIFTMLGCLVSAIYLGTLVYFGLVLGGLTIAPIWAGVTGIFVLERFITLRDRGWKHRTLALTMYELPYDYFLQACSAKAFIDAALRRKKEW